MYAFLSDLTRFIQTQDRQLEVEIRKLNDFLNAPEHYRLEELEQFITINYPQIYQQIIRAESGKSDCIASSKLSYQAHYGTIPEQNTVYCQVNHNDGEKGTTLLEEKGTTLLSEECGTTLLQNEAIATLVRKRTDDIIVISGQEFHIGKSMNVDYTIVDNNAISRNHAVIRRSFGDYFIADENSKNHTFVNDIMLVAEQQQRLRNGDIIKMADEEFEFNVN